MKWEIVRLGDYCIKIGSGATPKGGATVYIEDGVTLIRSQNVYNLFFEYDGLTHITDDAAEKLNGVTIFPDDILLNITGDSVARVCMVPTDVLPARVNQHVAIIRTRKDLLPQYLLYYLASPYMQAYMLNLAVGKGASRNALTKGMIEDFPMPLPSVEGQRRIIEILSPYSNLIKNNQKQIKLLEEAAQRLYKEWFVDLHFPGHETTPIVDGVPEGWHEGTIQDVIIYHDKKRKPLSGMQRAEMQGEYRYYGAASILDYVNDYLFDGTYLLLGEDGTVVTEDGFPVLQYVTGKFWVNNHAHVLTGQPGYPTEYLYMMFKSTKVKDVVTGAAQPKISQARLSNKKIIVPSKQLVSAYCDITGPMFKEIINSEHQITVLKEARNRLLPKLMSGEIEV